MVVDRAQPCNASSGRQCAVADQMRAGDAGGSGVAVELRQLVGGEVDLDFGHLV